MLNTIYALQLFMTIGNLQKSRRTKKAIRIEWDSFKIQDGLLKRALENEEDTDTRIQLVILKNKVSEVS